MQNDTRHVYMTHPSQSHHYLHTQRAHGVQRNMHACCSCMWQLGSPLENSTPCMPPAASSTPNLKIAWSAGLQQLIRHVKVSQLPAAVKLKRGTLYPHAY